MGTEDLQIKDIKQEYLDTYLENFEQHKSYFMPIIKYCEGKNLNNAETFILLAPYLLPKEFEKQLNKSGSYLLNLCRILSTDIKYEHIHALAEKVLGQTLELSAQQSSRIPIIIHDYLIRSEVIEATSIPTLPVTQIKSNENIRRTSSNSKVNIKALRSIGFNPTPPKNPTNYNNFLTESPGKVAEIVEALFTKTQNHSNLTIFLRRLGLNNQSKFSVYNTLLAHGIVIPAKKAEG